MADNTSLNAAKMAKQDEFYTRRETIEDELQHYTSAFENKTVYCNCDDPLASEFWKFFVRVFRSWHLKKLIATHYDYNEKNYAYKLELTGDGKSQPTITPLPCNGDFRSAACIELLKEADVVVTNPPFSLFREYIGQLMTYGKTFLVIGNLNAVTYKEIFPLLMENKIWLGYHNGHTLFRVPDYYTIPDFYDKNDRARLRSNGYIIDENGKLWRNLGNICWFTNIDIPKRHQDIDLRGNYYQPDVYPHYDNYDAIEVSKVADIPCDYANVMGVPISFIHKYVPDQFQIMGITDRQNTSGLRTKKYTADDTAKYNDLNAGSVLKMPDGSYKQVYSRILVKLKHPEPRRYPD